MIKQVSSDKLSEKKKMLEMTIANIKSISNSLIEKYREIKNEKSGKKDRTNEQFVSLHHRLQEYTRNEYVSIADKRISKGA
jgi:hypothetical protein